MGRLLDKIKAQGAADSADLRKTSQVAVSGVRKSAGNVRKAQEHGTELVPSPHNPQTVRTLKPAPHNVIRKSANPQHAEAFGQRLEVFATLVRSKGVDEGIYIEPGTAMAMLSVENREAIQNGTTDLARRNALANNIAQRVVRERGMIPAGWETVVLCEQCGPVWSDLDSGPAVEACEWCDLSAAGQWFPRPAVCCGECRHFKPDTINPAGGLGDCRANARRGGLCFPHSRRPCPVWKPYESAAAGGKTRSFVLVFIDEQDPAAAL